MSKDQKETPVFRARPIPLLLLLSAFAPALAGAAPAAAPSAPPAAAPAAAPAHKGLQPSDVFDLEQAADPQLSPDEKFIVYVRRFADIKTDRRHSNLWRVDTDGGEHRPLTYGAFNDANPVFSPDGKQLAFTSNRDGSAQIWIYWLESGQMARITNLTEGPNNLAFSPDGKSIAFTSFVGAKGPRIVTDMPAAPEGATWAEPAKTYDRLVYRANGAGYLDTGFDHIFVVPAEGGTPRQISRGDFTHNTAPRFTPDGKAVVVSANRRADWDLEPLDTELWEFPVGSGEPRQISNRKGPDGDPALSPDGKKIAYVGFDDRYQGYQVGELYVAPRDGSSAPKSLTAKLDRDAEDPAWAPDGRSIFFRYEDHGRAFLARVDMDGNIAKLAEDLGSSASAYSGGGLFTVGPKGGVAFATSDSYRIGDIAYLPPPSAAAKKGGPADPPKPRRLTDVNSDLLSQRTLGQVERLETPSKHDQRPIEAWLVKPPNFDPAKKYPLILEIHGGPFAAYGPHFDIEKQVWAARGFMVVYANPRGSTSYGQEFGNLIHHAYPGDDFFDLDSVVDAVIAKGNVDTDELYVTGGSGGGVLTCWTIGRTDRYRAAVTVYPVINWFSWVLTSDLPAFGTKYWFPGVPWEHTEHYMKRSLFSVFGNVVTPTMVITGEEDWRTPISESEQYYTALKLKGVEAVLVRVPGEPHGIRVRPSHHIAKILNIVGWFEKHRKPADVAKS
jgi:dipeptidyl aminopeptidase/acylaminoacyl peptidase